MMNRVVDRVRFACWIAWAGWLGLFAGCAPTRSYPKEEPTASAKALFAAGEERYRREDYAAAMEALRAAIAESPRYVMAHRLYQDASFAVRRLEPLVAEYEGLRNRDLGDPLYRYLYGRLQITVAAREREFRRARDADRSFAWAWNGLATVAHQTRRLSDAEKYYKRAIALSEDGWASGPSGQCPLVEPMVGLGKVYGLRGDCEKAQEVLEKAVRLDPNDPLPHAVLAVIYRDQRKYSSALAECERAVEVQPNYRPALEMIHNLAPRHAGAADLERCRACLQKALKECPGNPDILSTLGLLEMLSGQDDAALSHFEGARAGGPPDDSPCPVDYANPMRLLYVRKGEYDRALRVWKEKVPEQLIESPGNVLADRYRRLVDATEEATRRPDDDKALSDLATAYAQAGWVDEALALGERLVRRGCEGAAPFRDRVKRHIEFCDQIEQLFRKDYVRFQTKQRYRSLAKAIKEVEELGAVRTGRRFEKKTEYVDYPFLGRMTACAYPPRSDLMVYFDGFNQMLIMGKPSGSAPVECLLATMVSRQPNRDCRLWGVKIPNERVLVENVKVTGYHDTLEHRRTGGQTFASFFYTNIDAVWEWCWDDIHGFKTLWRPDRPFPSEGLPALLIDRMSGEPTRLLDLAYREAADGQPVCYFLKAMDLVDCHEMGHVADAHTHLPLSRFLLRDLMLGVQCGFSFVEMLAYTERNAELTALAHAESPRLVLGSLTKFVETGFDESPHAIGYRAIIDRFVREIQRAPADYPEIDATRRILDQLTRLPPEKIRSLARELADEWKIPQRVREVER